MYKSKEILLLNAIHNNRKEEAIKIINDKNNKCDLDYKYNVNSSYPIIYACFHECEEIAIQLINAKCNINVQANNGWTPLMYSCKSKKVAIKLLEAGCDINLRN